MKTKQKLKLEELKVQSFVTSLDENSKQTIEGGAVVTMRWQGCVPPPPGSSAPCVAVYGGFSVGYTVGASINYFFEDPTTPISNWVGTYFSNDGGC